MKQISYIINGKYGAVPETADLPANAENIEEFADVTSLHASAAFIAYKAEQDAPSKEAQSLLVISSGFSLNGKVTPITDLLYFIQLAQAGKIIIEAGDVATQTVTIPSMTGSYEATLADVNKILAGLETVRSNSIKVELGELTFDTVEMPLVLV
jgi:hypothetical protein